MTREINIVNTTYGKEVIRQINSAKKQVLNSWDTYPIIDDAVILIDGIILEVKFKGTNIGEYFSIIGYQDKIIYLEKYDFPNKWDDVTEG